MAVAVLCAAMALAAPWASGLGAGGLKGNDTSEFHTISANGRFLAFTSMATNLDPADTSTDFDVYVRDLDTGVTKLISRGNGPGGAKGNGESRYPSISGDGRYVAFY